MLVLAFRPALSKRTIREEASRRGVIDRVKTVDAHVGGQTLRLVVDGMPHPLGRTMRDKRAWLRKRADRLRRALVLEPRGHADIVAALLTEAVSPEAHAGILFMDG